MSCSSCDFLDEKKEKKGKIDGSTFYCKKNECYVEGNKDKCEKYKQAVLRKTDENNEIYRKGKEFNDNDTPVSKYLALLIIIIIFFILTRIIKP